MPRPDSRILEVQSYATMLWEALLMTASLRVKNDKYYVVLTHTTDGKKKSDLGLHRSVSNMKRGQSQADHA